MQAAGRPDSESWFFASKSSGFLFTNFFSCAGGKTITANSKRLSVVVHIEPDNGRAPRTPAAHSVYTFVHTFKPPNRRGHHPRKIVVPFEMGCPDAYNYLTRSLVELTNVGENTSITRINEKLQAFPEWNSAAIDKRHALLMALARDVWKTSPIEV